jgi:hypothetical protein
MVFRLPDGGPVRVRTSNTASETPTVNELEEGELALNAADGTLYFQTASDAVAQFPGSTGIKSIVSISQAAYDALAVKDSSTLYVIT